MQRAVLLIALNLLLVLSVMAQNRSTAATRQNQSAQRATANLDKDASARRRFWLSMSLSNVFDTNIDHDSEGVRSFGLIPGFGVHFRNSAEAPSLEVDYEVALHRYNHSNEFDRVSHSLTATYRKRLSKRLYARTAGEISLKGSSEDREVNNNYIVEQQLQYRFTSDSRLAVFGAYRVKRYPTFDSGSDAIDSYLGGRFDQRFGRDRQIELVYRYDHNRAKDPRDRYVRRNYIAKFSTPLSFERRDSLVFGFRFSPRQYDNRLVRVNGIRELRRDQRWVLGAAYLRPLRKDVTMALDYSYERRNSNDPEKRFSSNVLGLTFTFNWWR